jgi:hypothetical protein
MREKMTEETKNPFTMIRHRGQPNKATFEYMFTDDRGRRVKRSVEVYRVDKIYLDTWGWVSCVPYDDHFVFEVPLAHQSIGMWTMWCTCGSIAGVASPEDVKGRMVVCKFYHDRLYEEGHGYHQTSVINKANFEETYAGQTIEIPKGKRWLI